MKNPQVSSYKSKVKNFFLLAFLGTALPLFAVTAAQCLSMYITMESGTMNRYRDGQISTIEMLLEREFNSAAYASCMELANQHQE